MAFFFSCSLVQTSNYCAQTISTVALSAFLWTYTSQAHNAMTSTYAQGTTVYGTVMAVSAQATVAVTNVYGFSTLQSATSLVLEANGNPTSTGIQAFFSQAPQAPNFPAIAFFQFSLVPSLYPVPGVSASVQMFATLNVTFLGNSPLGNQHRAKLMAVGAPTHATGGRSTSRLLPLALASSTGGSSSLLASSTLGVRLASVQPVTSPAGPSPTSAVGPALVLALVSAVLLALV